jgi:hypothetical protein
VFWLNDYWQAYNRWALKFGQIFSHHHFISLRFEILTWILVWKCIIISYRWNFKFVPVNNFWPINSRWALTFGQIFSCQYFASLWFEILTWILEWECIITSCRSSLKFIRVERYLANLQLLGFEIWPNI